MSRHSNFNIPNRKICVRCKAVIHNVFRRQAWCEDCSIELQNMFYNGEEVLLMVTQMMPPTPPHPDALIRAWTVLTVARKVLQREGLLLTDDEQGNDPPTKKSPILT